MYSELIQSNQGRNMAAIINDLAFATSDNFTLLGLRLPPPSIYHPDVKLVETRGRKSNKERNEQYRLKKALNLPTKCRRGCGRDAFFGTVMWREVSRYARICAHCAVHCIVCGKPLDGPRSEESFTKNSICHACEKTRKANWKSTKKAKNSYI